MSELSFIDDEGTEPSRRARETTARMASRRPDGGRSRAATGLDRARQRRAAMQVRETVTTRRDAREEDVERISNAVVGRTRLKRANASDGGAEDARAIAIDRPTDAMVKTDGATRDERAGR